MNEITVIDHKVLATYSVVTNEVGERQAVALRGLIKKRLSELKEELKPFRVRIANIKSECEAQSIEVIILTNADKVIENACKKFKRGQHQQVDDKKKQLTVAQKKTDEVTLSPIPETIIESVPLPRKTVRTDNGSMSYIPKIKVGVTDITKVPLFYDPSSMTERLEKVQLLVISTVGLNELLRTKKGYKTIDGKIISEVEGLEFYEDMSTRVMK